MATTRRITTNFTYLGVAILSASAMAFEITLTRLFSVTQWYHFAFLAVSVALLGYGASGAALSLVPRWGQPPAARRASILSLLFSLAVIAAYLCLNHLPFDSYRIAWERIQVLYLVLYYLALTVPFFCAGMVTGLLLTAHPQQTTRLYAANLFGSAFGGLIPIVALSLVGEGTILVVAALGLLATFAFRQPAQEPDTTARPRPTQLVTTFLLVVSISLLLFLAWRPPSLFRLRLSTYKGLSQVLRFPDAEVDWQRWNAFSRVDRVTSSTIRSAPGLSLSYPGKLPQQDALFVDGDDLSPQSDGVQSPQSDGVQSPFTNYLPVALPYQLRPGAHALVLEPRGGLDLWVALSHGAAQVVAVESNPLLVEAAGQVYKEPRVQVVHEDGRSYARRSQETFDLVHLSLTDSCRPVTSGAYSLGERYDLTVEAFEDYLALLRPGGILVVERWLQLPPSEFLRAGATVIEALRRSGVEDPSARLAVVRGWQVGLILVKNGDLDQEELLAIRGFCQTRGLDPVALPGLTEAEANQLNILPEPVYYRAFRQLLTQPRTLYVEHPYDVRPPTDDQPFFFHLFKWAQARAVLGQLGKSWQPWGGSGYFVLVALLAVAVALSAMLILLPAAFVRRSSAQRTAPRIRVLVYFGLLGLGFLFVEIPLLQRFILFLGQPIYAFSTVVAALLFFSGLGSLAASRLSFRRTIPFLILAIPLYPLGLPLLFKALLGAPLTVRLLATATCLAPLGFLMGTPFPGGLGWLREKAPHFIPWAWAINGCASVMASVLAAMVALSAGFTWVLAAAALAYAGAWLALR
jgi:hypothetical protein